VKKLILLFIFCVPCFASEFKVIYTFQGGSDGSWPTGLAVGKNGYLYGATLLGGPDDAGTIFKMSRTGNKTILHSFTGGADGGGPENALTMDAEGDFYGTTNGGGSGTGCAGGPCGTIFKITPTGQLTTLYAFQGPPNDVAYIQGPLALDAQGNIYGIGWEGANSCGVAEGCGAVFELNTSRQETILHSFTGSPDGMLPSGPIVIANGILYGTTEGGGDSSCGFNDGYGCGVLYSIDLANGGESIIYTFEADSGVSPTGILADGKGNLYGDTYSGGTFGIDAGVLFKFTPGENGWTESVLYDFGAANDGYTPAPGLLLDKAGNLYGTTANSNRANTIGTAFKITPQGEQTILHNFVISKTNDRAPGGCYTVSGVVSYGNGVLYGTAQRGGGIQQCDQGSGAVFRVER
jgi:uncharacterized repeat protein (TIGR03803 family)